MAYRFRKKRPYKCPECGAQTYYLGLSKDGRHLCYPCLDKEKEVK